MVFMCRNGGRQCGKSGQASGPSLVFEREMKKIGISSNIGPKIIII
jgi:hypothetical protein